MEMSEIAKKFANTKTDEEMQKLDENRTVGKYYIESKMDF